MLPKVIIFLSILFGAFNCAIGPTHGFIFTNNTFAGEFNTTNDVKSLKEGSGCERQFLTLAAFGDAEAGSIAKANNITRISTIDHSTMSVLSILYSDYCTIVRGE